MKKFIAVFGIAAAFGAFVQPAHAAGTCSNIIKQNVEAQAAIDHPGDAPLTAIMPPVDESGGSVDSYEVPVVSTKDAATAATYSVMVDEVCGIISLDQKPATSDNPLTQ